MNYWDLLRGFSTFSSKSFYPWNAISDEKMTIEVIFADLIVSGLKQSVEVTRCSRRALICHRRLAMFTLLEPTNPLKIIKTFQCLCECRLLALELCLAVNLLPILSAAHLWSWNLNVRLFKGSLDPWTSSSTSWLTYKKVDRSHGVEFRP